MARAQSGRKRWESPDWISKSSERLDLYFHSETNLTNPELSPTNKVKVGNDLSPGAVTSPDVFSTSNEDCDDSGAVRPSWDVYIHDASLSDTKAVRNIIKSWREKEKTTFEHLKDSNKKNVKASPESAIDSNAIGKIRDKTLSSSSIELESAYNNLKDRSLDSMDSGDSGIETKRGSLGYFKACATPKVNRKYRKSVTFVDNSEKSKKLMGNHQRTPSPGVSMLFSGRRVPEAEIHHDDSARLKRPGNSHQRIPSPGIQMMFSGRKLMESSEDVSNGLANEGDAEDSTEGDKSVDSVSRPFNSVLNQWKLNQNCGTVMKRDQNVVKRNMQERSNGKDLNVNSSQVNGNVKGYSQSLPRPAKKGYDYSSPNVSSMNHIKTLDSVKKGGNLCHESQTSALSPVSVSSIDFNDCICTSSPKPSDRVKSFDDLRNIGIDDSTSALISDEYLPNVKVQDRIMIFESNPDVMIFEDINESKSHDNDIRNRKTAPNMRVSLSDQFRNNQIRTRSRSQGPTLNRSQVTLSRSHVNNPSNNVMRQEGNLSHLLKSSGSSPGNSPRGNCQERKNDLPSDKISRNPFTNGNDEPKLACKSGSLQDNLGKDSYQEIYQTRVNARPKTPQIEDYINEDEANTNAEKFIAHHAKQKVRSKTPQPNRTVTKEDIDKNDEKFIGVKKMRERFRSKTPDLVTKVKVEPKIKSKDATYSDKTVKEQVNQLAKSKSDKLKSGAVASQPIEKNVNQKNEDNLQTVEKETVLKDSQKVPSVAFQRSLPLPYKQSPVCVKKTDELKVTPDNSSIQRGRGRGRKTWHKDTEATSKSTSDLRSAAVTSPFRREFRTPELSHSPGRLRSSSRLSLRSKDMTSFAELGKSIKRSLTPSMENLIMDEDISYEQSGPDPVKLSGRLYRGTSEPNLFTSMDLVPAANRSSFSSGYDSLNSDRDHNISPADDSSCHGNDRSSGLSKYKNLKNDQGKTFYSHKDLSNTNHTKTGERHSVSDRFWRLTHGDITPASETIEDLLSKPRPPKNSVKRSSSLRDFRSFKDSSDLVDDFDLFDKCLNQKSSCLEQEPVKIITDSENGLVGYVFNV